jgi:hypothetical protein
MGWLSTPRLPIPNAIIQPLVQALNDYLAKVAVQVNGMSSGSIASMTSANTAPPAAGNKQVYAKGDWIENSNPVVTGTAGSQYIVLGWKCIAGGTPGTWVACRTLTGT